MSICRFQRCLPDRPAVAAAILFAELSTGCGLARFLSAFAPLTVIKFTTPSDGAKRVEFVYLPVGAYVTNRTYDCREGVMELVFTPALWVPITGMLAT